MRCGINYKSPQPQHLIELAHLTIDMRIHLPISARGSSLTWVTHCSLLKRSIRPL
eukprot:c56485_g1_i1 orf=179-343(-)